MELCQRARETTCNRSKPSRREFTAFGGKLGGAGAGTAGVPGKAGVAGPARPGLVGDRFGSRPDPDRSGGAVSGARARTRLPAPGSSGRVRSRSRTVPSVRGEWVGLECGASLSRARRPLTLAHGGEREDANGTGSLSSLPVFFFPSGRDAGACPYAQYAQRWFLYVATFDMVVGFEFRKLNLFFDEG